MTRSFLALFLVGLAGACSAGPHPGGDGGAAGGPLVFAVVGDTRPSDPCRAVATCPYPTQIITRIYEELPQLSPAPQLVVATGDYLFNEPGAGTASWQLGQYLGAAARFHGPVYPAMGNHECTGYTDSECGEGSADGVTENYSAFLRDLLGGLGLPAAKPYYAELVPAGAGQSAKFVFVAANAWDQAQATWLAQTLSQPTRYTFVVRHEPSAVGGQCPGVPPSDQIIRAHPLTLQIVGHSHEYRPWSASAGEVIVGNGGAPLSSGGYGFALCRQRPDGAIQCDGYDEQSNAPLGQPFALTPEGAPTAVQ
ncbi:MAG: metallophosphoesterase family protein [Myxococcales bacterium]